jgi:hydroxyacylglutathione hydrolase
MMQVTEHFHALRIPFKLPVSPEKLIERLVYSFVFFGDELTLIDSGVFGAETIIFDYIEKNGRDLHDISKLVLSHSHPDHLGSAKAIKEATGCMVLAHPAEKNWIEDTEMQYKERPVPGFHGLVGGPVAIDRLLSDGEILHLAKNIDCEVIHTPGHSSGSISLFCEVEKVIFSGDAIPLPDDLPIYEDIAECVASVGKLRQYGNVHTLLSSWEPPIHGHKKIEDRIEDGLSYLRRIHENVLKAGSGGKRDLMELCRDVVHELGLPPFAANPLVARAFASSLAAVNRPLFAT